MKSVLLMSYRKNLKSFASPNLMRSELDMTCSQALVKVKEVWMNGTMLYIHNCISQVPTRKYQDFT